MGFMDLVERNRQRDHERKLERVKNRKFMQLGAIAAAVVLIAFGGDPK